MHSIAYLLLSLTQLEAVPWTLAEVREVPCRGCHLHPLHHLATIVVVEELMDVLSEVERDEVAVVPG